MELVMNYPKDAIQGFSAGCKALAAAGGEHLHAVTEMFIDVAVEDECSVGQGFSVAGVIARLAQRNDQRSRDIAQAMRAVALA